MSDRWTLAGIAVTAIAATVSLIGSDSERLDPLAKVLVWALGLVVLAIVLKLAWTFPAFRGLVYKKQDRINRWRTGLRERRWVGMAYNYRDGGYAFSLGAPPGSQVGDEATAEVIGHDVRYSATVDSAVDIDAGRVSFWVDYPGDFGDMPNTLPAGRYKVRWSEATRRRKTVRFTVDELGRLRQTPRVRFKQWKRSLRNYASRREGTPSRH